MGLIAKVRLKGPKRPQKRPFWPFPMPKCSHSPVPKCSFDTLIIRAHARAYLLERKLLDKAWKHPFLRAQICVRRQKGPFWGQNRQKRGQKTTCFECAHSLSEPYIYMVRFNPLKTGRFCVFLTLLGSAHYRSKTEWTYNKYRLECSNRVPLTGTYCSSFSLDLWWALAQTCQKTCFFDTLDSAHHRSKTEWTTISTG